MAELAVTVRPAVPADRTSILDLWWQLAQEGEHADGRYRVRRDARSRVQALVETWLAPSGTRQVWVAETEHVVGFLAARPAEPHPVLDRPSTLTLTDMVVDPSARRRGIGRLLVDAAREHAARQGAGAIEVGTLALDARALAFWQAMGFAEWRVTLESPVDRR